MQIDTNSDIAAAAMGARGPNSRQRRRQNFGIINNKDVPAAQQAR